MAAREVYSRRGSAGPCLGPADESSSARSSRALGGTAVEGANEADGPFIALGLRPRGLEKLARVAARRLGHPLAAEHSRDLLHPARLVERGDRGPGGAAGHALVHDQVIQKKFLSSRKMNWSLHL